MIKLGARVRDEITGFEGVVTARCEYLNGEATVQLEHKVESGGKAIDARWFTESRVLEVAT